MLQPFCSFFVAEEMNGDGRTDFLDSVDRVFDVATVTVSKMWIRNKVVVSHRTHTRLQSDARACLSA